MDFCVISVLKRGKTSLEKLNKISNLRKTNMNLRLLNFKIHARELQETSHSLIIWPINKIVIVITCILLVSSVVNTVVQKTCIMYNFKKSAKAFIFPRFQYINNKTFFFHLFSFFFLLFLLSLLISGANDLFGQMLWSSPNRKKFKYTNG